MSTAFESSRFAYFPRWKKTLVRPLVGLILCVSFATVSQPASGQGFFFGQGIGVHAGGWGGGFGVAPSRIDISIGVPPSHPYPIGVRPSRLIPPPLPYFGYGPAWGAYPDYRLQYNLRIMHAHQAQLELAEAMGQLSTLPHTPYGVPSHSVPVPNSEPIAQDDWPAVTPENLDAVSEQMIQAARRLDNALARRGEEGDIWRRYLSTELIVASREQPLSDSEWTQVLQSFDGVVANSDLRWVMRSDGFAETRQWVSTWVNAKAAQAEHSIEVGNDPSTPPPAPQPARPRLPQPADSQGSNYETLPAPERARL